MANEEHVSILENGVEGWNEWRKQDKDVHPDLSGLEIRNANLIGFNLTATDLSNADLSSANLSKCFLNGANLHRAKCDNAQLVGADLTRAYLNSISFKNADLSGAWLVAVYMRSADVSGANLTGTIMWDAVLNHSNFSGATLSGCKVYGVSAWHLNLTNAIQKDLEISHGKPTITVDNIELAQFMQLIIDNKHIRRVIDTITAKVVLILGRFSPQRKIVLDGLRDELRRHDYVPILFDFDQTENRDITETISLLARMARFVVADITDASSVPQELGVIVPDLPSVPVQPLLLAGGHQYAMFEHFQRYPWVLPVLEYTSSDELIAGISHRVIGPAERKAAELRPAR